MLAKALWLPLDSEAEEKVDCELLRFLVCRASLALATFDVAEERLKRLLEAGSELW